MKRPGRPRLDDTDESVTVGVKLPSRQYDRLYAEAQRQHVTIPELIRQKIHRDDHDDDK